jgi:hypothetical protein
MDSSNYPQLVRELLVQLCCTGGNRHAQGKPSFGNIEVETIFDLEHDSPNGDATRTLSDCTYGLASRFS